MGNTTNLALPYPDPTSRVRVAPANMKALAERLDVMLGWGAAAVFPRTESPASAGAVAAVSWGASAVLNGFDYDGTKLTYLGDPRLFIVDVEVQVNNGSTGPGTGASSTVELRLNDTTFAGSYDAIVLDTVPIGARSVVHRITSPVRLNAGEKLDVIVSASPAGSLGLVGLRVYPIGPAA